MLVTQVLNDDNEKRLRWLLSPNSSNLAFNFSNFLAFADLWLITRFGSNALLSVRLSPPLFTLRLLSGVHLSGYLLGKIKINWIFLLFFFKQNGNGAAFFRLSAFQDEVMGPPRMDRPETLVSLCSFLTRQTASPLESEPPADSTFIGLRQGVLSGQCLLCLEPKHYEMRLGAPNMTNILCCVFAQYASDVSAACKVGIIL